MTTIYHAKEASESFLSKLKQELEKSFSGCNRIAIKLHFGEPGNDKSLIPADVKPIANVLEDIGIDYFLFDSSVKYTSLRDNPESHTKVALDKGWGDIGPVELSDKYIDIKKEHLTYQVCNSLVDADGVLVLSHFKGHELSGFGGAIKNLGMGALTKQSKSDIHDGGGYDYVGGCIQCGACERACPMNFIKVTDKPEFKDCWGCSNCAYACPVGAIKPKLAAFDLLLAEGAEAAASTFKKVYYITLVQNVTKACDCCSNPQGIIGPDCGILACENPVAIDKAAYDLVVAATGKDVFLENNKKEGTQQINSAEELGMGSSKYDIVEV